MGFIHASKLTLGGGACVTLHALFRLFAEARALSGHQDYVVIGSLSVLGLEESFEIPETMTMSVDADCYTKADPGRIFDVVKALGENSPFHVEHGFYLDGVSPQLPSLPDGWEDRLIKVERDGLRVWFLDPNDAALSKYARGEPRDRRWIRAGILSGVVSIPVVNSRFPSTNFYDVDEKSKARALIDADVAWFEIVKNQRSKDPGITPP